MKGVACMNAGASLPREKRVKERVNVAAELYHYIARSLKVYLERRKFVPRKTTPDLDGISNVTCTMGQNYFCDKCWFKFKVRLAFTWREGLQRQASTDHRLPS